MISKMYDPNKKQACAPCKNSHRACNEEIPCSNCKASGKECIRQFPNPKIVSSKSLPYINLDAAKPHCISPTNMFYFSIKTKRTVAEVFTEPRREIEEIPESESLLDNLTIPELPTLPDPLPTLPDPLPTLPIRYLP